MSASLFRFEIHHPQWKRTRFLVRNCLFQVIGTLKLKSTNKDKTVSLNAESLRTLDVNIPFRNNFNIPFLDNFNNLFPVHLSISVELVQLQLVFVYRQVLSQFESQVEESREWCLESLYPSSHAWKIFNCSFWNLGRAKFHYLWIDALLHLCQCSSSLYIRLFLKWNF